MLLKGILFIVCIQEINTVFFYCHDKRQIFDTGIVLLMDVMLIIGLVPIHLNAKRTLVL
jgi:hypothetical protein